MKGLHDGHFQDADLGKRNDGGMVDVCVRLETANGRLTCLQDVPSTNTRKLRSRVMKSARTSNSRAWRRCGDPALLKILESFFFPETYTSQGLSIKFLDATSK